MNRLTHISGLFCLQMPCFYRVFESNFKFFLIHISQQISFFVLWQWNHVLHFCIIKESKRRCSKRKRKALIHRFRNFSWDYIRETDPEQTSAGFFFALFWAWRFDLSSIISGNSTFEKKYEKNKRFFILKKSTNG